MHYWSSSAKCIMRDRKKPGAWPGCQEVEMIVNPCSVEIGRGVRVDAISIDASSQARWACYSTQQAKHRAHTVVARPSQQIAARQLGRSLRTE